MPVSFFSIFPIIPVCDLSLGKSYKLVSAYSPKSTGSIAESVIICGWDDELWEPDELWEDASWDWLSCDWELSWELDVFCDVLDALLDWD